jgi:hypothetical protein
MRIPWLLILVFFSIASFYYFNEKRKIRRDQRKERLDEKREELLEALRRSRKDNTDEKDNG